MTFTRRKILLLGSGAVALSVLPAATAFASKADDAVSAFTGGADAGSDGISLTAPEIAENGNTVPIGVSAPGAIAIAVFATGNPEPKVATFSFGPLNPTRSASTRIRLSQTQDVIAVAKMEDGSFKMARSEVKVTIGGCGG